MEKDLKSEAIRKAWIDEIGEENYARVEKYIDENSGLAPFEIIEDAGIVVSNLGSPEYGFLRPKSLHGIEDNNGWKRIEPDGSNLPKSIGEFWAGKKDGEYFRERGEVVQAHVLLRLWHEFQYTHFKPIEKSKPPIY